MVITNLSDPLFTRLLMSELQKVVDRLVEHVWPRALHLVSTPVVVNGQEFGLLSKTVSIHMNQLEMWTKDSCYASRQTYIEVNDTYSEGGTHEETLHPQRKAKVMNKRRGD